MQKIERWRVEELSLLLSEISSLLMKGDNSEWANVFSHFHDETKNIISKKELDLDSLERLVRNIKNCFSMSHSFNDIFLWREDSKEREKVNRDFYLVQSRLFNVLNELEKLSVERIH
jgi:hypothetical protein